MMDETEMSLLNDERVDMHQVGLIDKQPLQRLSNVRWRHFIYAQLLLIILLAMTTASVVKYHMRTVNSTGSLPDIQLNYLPQVFNNSATPDSEYAGPPGLARDQAWRDFIPMTLRVSESELDQNHQASIALPEGGYMARLGVFHEIHCLAFLRQWNHRNYYYPQLTTEEEKYWTIHADHCIEVLRQAAVCHADSSIQTFKWDLGSSKPVFDPESPSVHSCVDWTKLMQSMEHRVVTRDEIDELVNPLQLDRKK